MATELSIDEQARRRFEAAWLARQPLAIEACLPPQANEEYLPTLEELVHIELEFTWKAWSERQKRGALDGAATAKPDGIECYLKRFPALRLPEVLSRLTEQEQWARERYGAARPAADDETMAAPHAALVTGLCPMPDPPQSLESRETARRFGNYELLEEIGRGGMGVVYRARQLSAGRIVALKVIPAPRGGLSAEQHATAVERFRHEALATARLQHEHIVTVYEVGEEAGEPYFSMQYVDGASLAELLHSGPLESRRAACLLEPVARAVAAAHELGVLHRDLKPQNILVERRSDRALVADFGLAKLLELPGELTQAGDVMGTPSYMPPEQARDSSRVTPQSDVYSLGATLYHMLAGRPPFLAASVLETLRQVQSEEAAPPSRLNRAIDRDLETICLTCLHKEPERRYASASAFADDLKRYLDGFPIHARPTGPLERGARWCRRNPLLAGTAALALAFLIAALVATSVGYATTAAALAESERSYRHSREVVNQFFTLVSEDELLNQPGSHALRNDLLQLALMHFERFLAERGEEPELLEEIARTHYRVALIQQAIEPSPSAGLASLERALQLQRRLTAEAKPHAALQDALADTLNALGQVQQARGDSEAALAMYREARTLREDLARNAPPRSAAPRKLANTIMNMGLAYKQQQRLKEALQSLDEAQRLRHQALVGRTVAAASDEELLLWRDLAQGHYNRANLSLTTADADSVEQELTPAIAILEGIASRVPSDLRNRQRLAGCYHLAARWRQQARDLSGARARYEQAVAVLEELHEQSPQVVEFAERLALVQMDFGVLQARQRRATEALACYQSACELLRPLVPDPQAVEHAERRRNYAVALRELGRLLLDMSQPFEAKPHLILSQQYLEALIDQAKDDSSRERYRADLEETQELLRRLQAV